MVFGCKTILVGCKTILVGFETILVGCKTIVFGCKTTMHTQLFSQVCVAKQLLRTCIARHIPYIGSVNHPSSPDNLCVWHIGSIMSS